MVVETRYVSGGGVLVGAGALWALFTDPGVEHVVDEVWEIAAHSGTDARAPEHILQTVEASFGGSVPALAIIDLRDGVPRTTLRGAGVVMVDGETHLLSLNGMLPSSATKDRRLVSGSVSASAARVRPAAPARSGARSAAAPVAAGAHAAVGDPGGSLIDGIPAAILAAKGPDGPPPPRPRLDPVLLTPTGAGEYLSPDDEAFSAAAPDSVEGSASTEVDLARADEVYPDLGPVETTGARLARIEVLARTEAGQLGEGVDTGGDSADDHDGATVHRPAHLQAPEIPTVLAVRCPSGHPSSPALPACRVCHQRIAPQEPHLIPRPALGGLRLPTGEVVPLDRGVIIGRKPAPLPGSVDWPHLVHLPAGQAFVSRLHLEIEVDGWDVLARDLGSRGGTTLTPPGKPPFPLRGGEGYVLEPGSVLDLAQVYAVRFETGAAFQ